MNRKISGASEAAAQGTERVLLVPIALEVEAVKRRAERANARLESGGLLNIQTANDAISLLLGEIGEVSSDIEFLMDGQTGLGPATACRDALREIVVSLAETARTRKGRS